MNDYNMKKDSNGDPLITECQKYNFGEFYGKRESHTLWRALLDNNQGIQDKFVAYWVHVAKRFANNKFVMGFDPLNEPNQGNDNYLRSIEANWAGF
jgi:aryl-phospho-beta-D-glucosidase BglC (GH1 family)